MYAGRAAWHGPCILVRVNRDTETEEAYNEGYRDGLRAGRKEHMSMSMAKPAAFSGFDAAHAAGLTASVDFTNYRVAYRDGAWRVDMYAGGVPLGPLPSSSQEVSK